MTEISLHLLDLLQNCARARAKRVEVRIRMDEGEDSLALIVRDDGDGMDETQAREVLDPFYTTKAEKRVGLGLPLLAHAARQAGGSLTVETAPGQGTVVSAILRLSHVDRQPIGDLASTMVVFLAGNPEVGIDFQFQGPLGGFVLSTDDAVDETGVRKGQLAILGWYEEKLRDGLARAGFRPDGGGSKGEEHRGPEASQR